MPYHLQDPGEKLDYTCEWTTYLDDAGSPSDTISSFSSTITPQSGSPLQPNLSAETISGTKTTVWVDGCIRGEVYRLTQIIVTSQGRTAEQSIAIRAEDR